MEQNPDGDPTGLMKYRVVPNARGGLLPLEIAADPYQEDSPKEQHDNDEGSNQTIHQFRLLRGKRVRGSQKEAM